MKRLAATTAQKWIVPGIVLVLCHNGPGLELQVNCNADDGGRPGVDRSDPSDVLQSYETLSQGSYSQRQKATLELWRRRDATRDEVQQATRHPDPEVAQRANWILRQWRRGAVPGNTPDVLRLLSRTDGHAAIDELLEAGQFTAAVVAVEEVAGTLQREEVHTLAADALQRRFPIYVKLALELDALPDLLRLVDLVANSRELAVCRIEMMRLLGQDVDEAGLLPTSAETWSLSQRRHALVLVLTMLDRFDDALKEAEESRDEGLIRVCRMLAGDWKSLAADSAVKSREAENASLEKTRHWCHAMIAAERCGDRKVFDDAVGYLSSEDADSEGVAASLAWQCLAMHGEVEHALSVLKRISPIAASQVAMTSSRAEYSFDVLGYSLNELDENLGRWIDQAIEAQRAEENARVSVEVGNLLMLMRALTMVGRDDAARRIADSLSRSDVKVGKYALRDSVLWSLILTTRSDWIIDLAVLPGEKSISSKAEESLVRTLSSMSTQSWKVLLGAVAAVRPGLTFRDRVRSTHKLINGELPDGFDPKLDFDRLYERLTNSRIPLSGRQTFQSSRMQVGNNPINKDIAEMFARHGRGDLASQCTQWMLQRGDLEAAFRTANREIECGRLETAESYLEYIWDEVRSQSSVNRQLRIGLDDVELVSKALVGQWVIARRRGDLQRSEYLEQQLRLTFCTPSTRLRHSLAGQIADQVGETLSGEAYKALLVMTAFGSDEGTEFFFVARDYATLLQDDQPATAAKWLDLAMVGTLESISLVPMYYLVYPKSVRRMLIEDAILQSDIGLVKRHVRQLRRLDPMDIDFAENLIPAMRDAGMRNVADETFDTLFQQGKAYLEKFPFDATTSNNLAWVAAMNHRSLDDALPLVQRAVDREPESAIYRDTLAEVLFQLGRKEEALQVEKACVLDDPGQWHLHTQIEKYREAISR